MLRPTVKRVTIGHLRAESVYPDFGGSHTDCPAGHSARWKGDTVAVRLSRQQALELAKLLRVGSRDYLVIDVTAYRTQQREDGTHPVTVTARLSTKRVAKA